MKDKEELEKQLTYEQKQWRSLDKRREQATTSGRHEDAGKLAAEACKHRNAAFRIMDKLKKGAIEAVA